MVLTTEAEYVLTASQRYPAVYLINILDNSKPSQIDNEG